MRTLRESYRSLLAHLPPGLVSRLGPQLRLILEAIADFFRTDASNRVDAFRAETNPAQCTALASAWEQALDLAGTKTASLGVVERRRLQILGAMRAQGDLSIPGMRDAVAPFLDYADPTQIEVLESDRAALMTAHTYPSATALPDTIPKVGSLDVYFDILDDGPVSDAGAQVFINVTGNSSRLTFDLSGPGGGSQRCFFDAGYLGDGAVTTKSYVLFASPAKVLALTPGVSIQGATKGRWTLRCVNLGIPTATLHSASLFVEALGRNALGQECLGNELHSFAVIADVALMGPQADLEAARDAAEKQKPAYTGVALVIKDLVHGGGTPAIPDLPTTIPDESLPG